MAASKSKSARYYASHPEAAAKKAKYQRKLNKDLSHRTDGKMVLESPAKNRARNGHGNNAVKKPIKRKR